MIPIPDGAPQTLIDINAWDYNWQETYMLKEPIIVKAGTKFHVDAYYDNNKLGTKVNMGGITGLPVIRYLPGPPDVVMFQTKTHSTGLSCACGAGVGLSARSTSLVIAPAFTPCLPCSVFTKSWSTTINLI